MMDHQHHYTAFPGFGPVTTAAQGYPPAAGGSSFFSRFSGGAPQPTPVNPSLTPYGQPPMSMGPQPQVNSWLFNKQTAPAFAPPAPAEAAASWANHAAVANMKAQDALRDISQIKATALAKLQELSDQSAQAMAKVEQVRDATVADLQRESQLVWNNYMAAKGIITKMLKDAEAQAQATFKISQNLNDVYRQSEFANDLPALKNQGVGGSSANTSSTFAQIPTAFPLDGSTDDLLSGMGGGNTGSGLGSVSGGSTNGSSDVSAALAGASESNSITNGGTDDLLKSSNGGGGPDTEGAPGGSNFPPSQLTTADEQDLQHVMGMIKQYMQTLQNSQQGASNSSWADPLGPVSMKAKADSAAASSKAFDAKVSSMKESAAAAKAAGKAEARALIITTKLMEKTMGLDAANAISKALKEAKDAAQRFMLKEIDSEKQLIDVLRQAQTSVVEAANIASKAEAVATQAATYARQMAMRADYAQNAAGQAMAAQMAQAMGYPVAVKGEPSPFPLVEQMGISPITCIASMVVNWDERKKYLSTCF